MVDDSVAHLGFSMHHLKGVYALLIGSGVSRSAGIMTGDQVLQDFIAEHAGAIGSDIQGNAKRWYQHTYDEEPSYSKVLERFAKHGDVRANALETYFAPTVDERVRGIKTPVEAHRMIAELVRDGYVKLVITTNFDRLIEQALDDTNVSYRVITFDDIENGTLVTPLQHINTLVVKLHGDYRSGKLLNTESELSEYKSKTRALLKQIADEYGIVACGWSADWDIALRSTIEARSRQYPFYYAHYAPNGEPSDITKQLLVRSEGFPVEINGADRFFSDLVKVIRAYRQGRARPFNREIAKAETLRLLAMPDGHIELEEIWRRELEAVYAQLNDDAFYADLGMPYEKGFPKTIERYDSSMETLLVLVAYLCWYGEGRYSHLIRDTVTRLAEIITSKNENLPLYPILSIEWVVGTIAVIRDEWRYVQAALIDPKVPRWKLVGYVPRELPRRFAAFLYSFLSYTPSGKSVFSEGRYFKLFWPIRSETLARHVQPLVGSKDQVAASKHIFDLVFAVLITRELDISGELTASDFVVVEQTHNRESWHEILDWAMNVKNKNHTDLGGLFQLSSLSPLSHEALASAMTRHTKKARDENSDYPLFEEAVKTQLPVEIIEW